MDDKIIEALQYNKEGKLPLEELQTILKAPEEYIPELLNILEYTVENKKRLTKTPTYFAHIYALFLLAELKEERALLPIIKLIKLPGEELDMLLGDIITENLKDVLAAV